MAAPPLTTAPSTKTLIGTFEQQGNADVFQVLGEGGSVVAGMNNAGVIYNTVGNFVVSVAPIVAAVMLPSAQLLALHATPVVLVPAPGAGLVIVPVSISFIFQYVAPTYQNSGSDANIYIGYGTTGSSISTNDVAAFSYSGLIEGTSSQLQSLALGTSAIALSTATNQPLSIGILDTLTTGAGKLQVDIAYNIAPATF